MMRNNKAIRDKLNNKGETMLEMIISVAIFALMMTFMATIFSAANNIESSNYDTRNDMNKKLLKVSNASLSENDSLESLEVSGAKTVDYKIKYSDGKTETGSFRIKSIKDSVAGYEKVVVEK